MKKLICAAVPALFALTACGGEAEAPDEAPAAASTEAPADAPAEEEAPATIVDDDNDAPEPVVEEHAEGDHEHDGEDAEHAH